MFGLDFGLTTLLVICILCVCAFEFINGFHDTANAVATVIYTKSMRPTFAVVFSGILNGIGVFLGGTAVAMGIINLLPVETLVDQNVAHSLGMVAAILITAIFWNLGTWYLAIPASSSHTLIGSILGCGIAYSLLPGAGDAAVNWRKATDVGLSLLVSPLFGFLFALMLMGLLRGFIPSDKTLFEVPDGDSAPPTWIRATLILTCGLVSFSHGSNDGQKGIGLMMLVLIGILPAKFAINDRYSNAEIYEQVRSLQADLDELRADSTSSHVMHALEGMDAPLQSLATYTQSLVGVDDKSRDRFQVRRQILLLLDAVKKAKAEQPKDLKPLAPFFKEIGTLKKYTDNAPSWVIALIAMSLGIGTMIGWKRIVITIGEKIGKTHLTYAQGASAEIVAASTIGVSTFFGLPVSTTHVLSSGIAGAMFASGGKDNLDTNSISKILLAWILTFPVCLTLSGTLFLIFRSLFE
ncbi:MAG: inorganic phosphate transporter [Pirellula sp.]